MDAISFYLGQHGWVLGSYIGIPSGTFTRRIDGDGNITIKQLLGTIQTKGIYSDFLDSAGNPYASLDAFKTATDGFFSANRGKLFRTFHCLITRPANHATPYVPGDVVGDVSATLLPFLTEAGNPIATEFPGMGIRVYRTRIQTSDGGTDTKKFRAHLYNQAVDPIIADNDPFAITDANSSKRRGSIEIVTGTGTMAKVGQNDINVAGFNPVANSIYPILESVDGFTPSADSTTFLLEIDCELSN